MDLFQILWNAFSLDKRSVKELIEISSLIDEEKNKGGLLVGETDDFSVIASTIVALINEKSTTDVGKRLDSAIKELIVKKNFSMVDLNDGEKLYEQLQKKDTPGTYKVRRISNGYKFDLVTSNGEFLGASELYSSIDSCMNGIATVQRNANAFTEDQTISNYEVVRNPKYEVYCDKSGEFRFRLKAMNGQIIMVSAGYKNKKMCLEVISKIKKSADSIDVEKN